MNHPVNQKWFTTTTLADILACSAETIRAACDRGELESFRVGRDRRIPESAVREWLGGATGAKVVPLGRRRRAG